MSQIETGTRSCGASVGDRATSGMTAIGAALTPPPA